jgi:NTP pyrophosphatase (non-canonical NTP hydrolase)
MSDQVMINRATLENLLAGWDDGLWGPETQDAGVPETIVGIVESLRAAALAPAPATSSGAEAGVSFQARGVAWVREAFGSEPADCKEERAHRFLEESLELVQAAGTTESEAQQLVEYVYGRSTGEVAQEVGGVMLTLAPFAAAHGVDMQEAGERELARVNTPEIIAKCRRKNASKPRNSPLPGTAPALAGAE